jgi:two-component system nitrogen regulation sensor histidine kinase NtrY
MADESLSGTELGGLPPLDRTERQKRRREWGVAIMLVALFGGLTLLEFRFTKISSTLPFVNSIFFFGLLNINLIILIALIWLVSRNIGKLFIERRRKVLGARLKTKLVIAFLAFSIIPTLVLFFVSALYINSSFDKWFSLKILNTLEASLDITRTYYKSADESAQHFAEHISKSLLRRASGVEGAGLGRPGEPPAQPPKWLGVFLEAQRELLGLDAVEYYFGPMDARVLAKHQDGLKRPDRFPRLSLDVLERAFAGETVSTSQHIASGDLIRSVVPVRNERGAALGVVVVNSYILVSLVSKVDAISSVFADYKDVNPLKYPMKTTYLVILVMITLVLIFVAIWVGLYMARELTVPVERLVLGAQAVGAGNLDVRIAGSGHDEIAVLVDSFNRMTADLRENRRRLVQASTDLEKRRMQLEAVLSNVGTGVFVVDPSGEVTTFNRAASALMGVAQTEVLGKHLEQALPHECSQLVDAVKNALQNLTFQSGGKATDPVQWSMRVNGEHRTLNAVLTPLRELSGDTIRGVVVVIDDLTFLMKGQREMAWREVARRIAHEIKNPLTPIKLSAQRLQRRLSDLRGKDSLLLKECTDTIIRHTDELKEMVNEFSNFARFPEISPTPNDLNNAIREVVSLYSQAHRDVTFAFEAESKLPVFEFDRDQVKRVFINLIDNAVAAIQGMQANGRPKQITIQTHYNPDLQMAAMIVTDSGPGMPEDVRARAFEPYFSTKAGGSGLGLAIAKRIVNDHDGFIRVQSVLGQGTQFLIELPTRSRQKLELTE